MQSCPMQEVHHAACRRNLEKEEKPCPGDWRDLEAPSGGGCMSWACEGEWLGQNRWPFCMKDSMMIDVIWEQ